MDFQEKSEGLEEKLRALLKEKNEDLSESEFEKLLTSVQKRFEELDEDDPMSQLEENSLLRKILEKGAEAINVSEILPMLSVDTGNAKNLIEQILKNLLKGK